MADAIMIQGTMSNAGKSLIAAALCRIFMRDGYKTAPFKSQNMALNSFVTNEGYEIGRAQAMQAEAAGVEPSALMNPILLKPTSDMGSQVIVNGEVVGNMRAMEYFKRKKEFIPDIINAYNTLSAQNDIIVIEGAGSPVELNLKKDDIVNMGMAKMAKAPVLLVGDIDRGGVFAQLLGTLSLLENDERALVKGLIVNKFRGDIRLFDDGIKILEERSGVPVVGVVPFIRCNIDDEDSLSDKLSVRRTEKLIDIAVIKLPKMSNYTDFDVFLQYDNVGVRYVSSASEIGSPDMLIIPGTKSTIADMEWLRASGTEDEIKRLVHKNVPLFGICGGYQMLGRKISDPYISECGGEVRGMGLLDTETVFTEGKIRRKASGVITVSEGFFSAVNGSRFEGYEIHMGVTEVFGKHFCENESGCLGSYSGNVCGCYIHGIFDSEQVSEKIIRKLFEQKNMCYRGTGVSRKEYKESQYELLASEVRKCLDMDMIYNIMGK